MEQACMTVQGVPQAQYSVRQNREATMNEE
jgi:hypothetical protein